MPIKVLHIEDNPSDALLLRETLREAGGAFELHQVDRLAAGFALLEKQSVDVILLDMSLPDSSGLETYKKIHERHPHIPVIVLSSLADEASAMLTVQAGVQDWLSKDELIHRTLARSIRYAIERHRADEALLSERGMLRALIDSLPDQIYVKDVNSKFIACNPAVAKLLGQQRPEEVVGRTDFDFFPYTAAEKFMNEEKAVLAGHPRVNREERVFNPAGEERWLLTTKVPLVTPDGKITGLVGLNRDITERKRAEDRLVRALADMKKAQDALKAAQLNIIQIEKMETLGRLAAGVAHEVKNPLAVAIMGLEYLKMALGEGHAQAAIVTEVYDSIRRADTVIGGLLDFSKPRTLVLKQENLNELLEQTLLLVRHELKVKHIELVHSFMPQMPGVKVDGNKLKQVFINLIVNAVHAMPENSVLRVRSFHGKAGELRETDAAFHADKIKADETVVGVHVEDSGTGIAEHHLAQIFEPFFTTKPPGQGTGLGLPVVKQIVEMHRGVLEIRNRREGGVCATVALIATVQDPVGQGI